MIVIIGVDDWEAMYIGGTCVYQGHGMDRYDFVELLEEYKLDSSHILSLWADGIDEDEANQFGSFPNNLSELKGNYPI